MPGQKYDSIRRPRVYEALLARGYAKERAARIANRTAKAAAGPQAISPTGPGGLLPRGLGGRREKAMRPRRRLLWSRAYREAKAAGHDPAKARRAASAALKKADAARARDRYERAVGRLSVFKDADGRDRWLSVTTTAYRDQDGEYISRKAILGAVALGDRTGDRGVLRYWHVPGLDLGPCDYQAAAHDGRMLVESGTFFSPQHARVAQKAAAAGWQMSPGFYHPEREPDALGVYDHIVIFERSFAPPGRASNLYTLLATTKDRPMLTAEKRKELERLAPPEVVAAFVAAMDQTDKAAQRRATFKESAPLAVYTLPDGTPGVLQGGQFVPLAVAAKAPMPAAEMVQAGATEVMDGMAEEVEADDDEAEVEESILSAADIDAIAARVVEQLMAAMDGITAKMTETDEAMKMRGYQRMKETQDALALKVAELTQALQELTGDLPAGATARATQSPTTKAIADDPVVRAGAEAAGAETGAAPPPSDPVGALAAWIERETGGRPPWSIGAGAEPPVGAQHQAPGVRQ